VLELGFGLILMFYYGVNDTNYPWTIVDFIFGIILAIFLFSLPGFIICFYSKYLEKLKD
jgi:ABC-type sulfate transport system permease component